MCALFGPQLSERVAKKAVTPYVQWVLSRNKDVRDQQGRTVDEVASTPL